MRTDQIYKNKKQRLTHFSHNKDITREDFKKDLWFSVASSNTLRPLLNVLSLSFFLSLSHTRTHTHNSTDLFLKQH